MFTCNQVDANTHTLAKYLMELTIVEYDLAEKNPSEIAAASLCLAMKLNCETPEWVSSHLYGLKFVYLLSIYYLSSLPSSVICCQPLPWEYMGRLDNQLVYCYTCELCNVAFLRLEACMGLQNTNSSLNAAVDIGKKGSS